MISSPLSKRLPITQPYPALCGVFDEHVVLARLERFELRDRVRIQLVVDAREVVRTHADRQRRTPVVRVALVADGSAVVVSVDQIIAACDRLLERELVERNARAVRPHAPLVRKHRNSAREQRHLACRDLEIEANREPVDHHRTRDLPEVHRELRQRLRTFQRVERELHVRCGDRIAVREARFRIDVEGCGQAVPGDVDVVGEQAVRARHFVGAAGRQAFEHQSQSRCGIASQRKRVEFIEARQPVRIREHERAVTGCVGVDVVEVFEIGGIFGLAVLRDRVHRASGIGTP
ncbi:hypothetical protein QFZ89_007185 [Paraburkholderia youngii]